MRVRDYWGFESDLDLCFRLHFFTFCAPLEV
jgi:hypothetical protein